MKALLLAVLFTVMSSLPQSQGAEYYGKEIGELSTLHHLVRGTVYAVDDKRIYIRGLSYDGAGPDAYFWIGEKSKGVSGKPDDKGTKIPDEYGREEPLKAYANMNIVLTLPGSLTLSDIKWLSVWCRNFSADFGNVKIDDDFDAPAPKAIGEFVHLAHNTHSDTITIIDHRTIEIQKLLYDGRGPAAWFWVGEGSVQSQKHNGKKVPDENGSLELLKAYSGQTVTIHLPKNLTVYDIDWFSIYCITATQLFAYINIPDSLNVPAFIDEEEMEELENCQSLHDYMQVSWQIEEDIIFLDLVGSLKDREYMAFGLSGSDSGTSMFNADAIVAFYDFLGPEVVDYKLTGYSQCSNGVGACPDVDISGGKNDVEIIAATKQDGITSIRMKRALNTGDTPHDSIIHTDRTMYIVWAIGVLNDNDLVTKHDIRPTGDVMLNFGREAMKDCPALEMRDVEEVTPWAAQTLDGAQTKTFKVSLGPTGNVKGYSALTGLPSWGIAWYVNDLLIPEMTLRRGHKYTFITNGGDDDGNAGQYHPFYITSDREGGRIQKNTQQKMAETVYVGEEADGSLSAGTVGKYCEWNPTTVDKWRESESFEEYKDTLTYTCEPDTPGGTLEWTPDANTPDLVYYQCYTHRYLGWKIHIVNSDGTTDGGTGTAITCCWSLLLAAILMYLIV